MTIPHINPAPLTRRDWLSRAGMGMGSLALAGLMSDDLVSDANAASASSMSVRRPHFRPTAKHVIHIFLNGGASQVDTFDPKPELTRMHGKTLPLEGTRTERKTGAAFKSPFSFKKYGESGIEVSEIFSHVGEQIDECCLIRSMHADVPNHEPSLLLMNCGDSRLVRPSVGSWLTYGLGTENQNLPGFIVLCPNGYPTGETINWRSAFLPGVYQGTHVDTRHTDIEKLVENIRNPHLSRGAQRSQLDLLQRLNRQHAEARDNAGPLEARIQSFELAFNMQMEATNAFDVTQEPKHIQERYGKNIEARQILIARRLVERGVRYVQVWQGAGQPWDSHDDLERRHRQLAGQVSPAIGTLIADLKERGLLDETLIIVSGEFGRTPVVEMPTPGANQGKINGRDHNHYGFTTLLAGGGVRKGHVHGATDEFGFKAVEDRVHVHDLHATMLHLLGFDHKKLTYRYAGRDFRLTDVHGNVVHDIIA